MFSTPSNSSFRSRDPKFRPSVGTFVCVEGRTSTVATCECIEDRRSGFLERASGIGHRRSVFIVHRASTIGFHRASGIEGRFSRTEHRASDIEGRVFYHIMSLFKQVESECLICFNEFNFCAEKTLNQKKCISKMFSFFNSNFRYMRRTRVPSKVFVLLLNLKTQMSKGLAFLRQ